MLFLFPVLLMSGGEVIASSETSFVIETTFQVSTSAERVFEALVDDVGEWWDSEHTWSGESDNLSIEPRAGGCFCEELEDGGSARHLEVVYVQKGKIL